MSSPSPGPSTEAPFTPRKEFIKESPNQPNSFALLALSGPNCIRLYSFVHFAVASIRRLLEQSSLIISSREDAVQNLYEFTLDGKPWANPKSVPTEKLLVDIIAVIYQCGYTYLSLIDYGREADDRLAMTFSKPVLASRSPTPLPSSSSPKVDDSTSSSGEKCLAKRVPFAISFSSVTVMRVISPPLHLTPAILQAVRASWPRGVVAEKKVADNSYEFKLKGYKCMDPSSFILLPLFNFQWSSRVSAGYLCDRFLATYTFLALISRCPFFYPFNFNFSHKSFQGQGSMDFHWACSRGWLVYICRSCFGDNARESPKKFNRPNESQSRKSISTQKTRNRSTTSDTTITCHSASSSFHRESHSTPFSSSRSGPEKTCPKSPNPRIGCARLRSP